MRAASPGWLQLLQVDLCLLGLILLQTVPGDYATQLCKGGPAAAQSLLPQINSLVRDGNKLLLQVHTGPPL